MRKRLPGICWRKPGGERQTMRNLAFLVVLALAVVIAAGCTGDNGSSPVHSDTLQGTADIPAPDARPALAGNDNSTAASDVNTIPSGETRSYPMNITDANKNPMTRGQFLEANREYTAYLAKEVGEVEAEKMVNEEYRRSIGPLLLDPSSGNDTLISIGMDPVGDHVSGETFSITGSTNLPSGRELTLVVFRGNYLRAIPAGEDPWHDPVVRNAVVQAGPSSKNSWSYRMNTTGLVPDDYLVYIRETRNDAFLASTLFHLF